MFPSLTSNCGELLQSRGFALYTRLFGGDVGHFYISGLLSVSCNAVSLLSTNVCVDEDSNLLFIPAASDISTSSACCPFPVTLLACCLRGVHDMIPAVSLPASANSLAWSADLPVLVSRSFPFCTVPAASLARSASARLGPIGRLN